MVSQFRSICGRFVVVMAVLLAGLSIASAQQSSIPNPHQASAKPPALAPETVIARFDSESITVADLDAAVGAVTGPERLEFQSAEPLREMIDGLVDRRLMAKAAKASGLDKDPALAARLAAASPPAEQVLADAYLERELAAAAPVTDREIDSFYREHVQEFTIPARVRVIRAVAATESAAGKLREVLAKGGTVTQLREADPQHLVLADEVWIQDRLKKNELEAAALNLKPGATSPVFGVATGFAVLRAEEIAPARVRPLAEVSDGIRARLVDERRSALAAQRRTALRKGVAVSVDERTFGAYLQALRGGS